MLRAGRLLVSFICVMNNQLPVDHKSVNLCDGFAKQNRRYIYHAYPYISSFALLEIIWSHLNMVTEINSVVGTFLYSRARVNMEEKMVMYD